MVPLSFVSSPFSFHRDFPVASAYSTVYSKHYGPKSHRGALRTVGISQQSMEHSAVSGLWGPVFSGEAFAGIMQSAAAPFFLIGIVSSRRACCSRPKVGCRLSVRRRDCSNANQHSEQINGKETGVEKPGVVAGLYSLVDENGPSALELADYLPVPVVAADTMRHPRGTPRYANGFKPQRLTWSAAAPCAARDGYSDRKRRGPRFCLLPPPPSGDKLSLRDGPGQACLRSRIDYSTDLRLSGESGKNKVGGELSHTVLESSVCLVPEPYYRAARPDQRVRKPAIAGAHVSLERLLENDDRINPRSAGDGDDDIVSDVALMRRKLKRERRLVSGKRSQLENSLKAMKRKEEDDPKYHDFTKLGIEDLRFECFYRDVDFSLDDEKRELVDKIQQGFQRANRKPKKALAKKDNVIKKEKMDTKRRKLSYST